MDLQKFLTALALDLNLYAGQDESMEGKISKSLRWQSLGVLNALSMDLIRIKDYKAAVAVFSYQFYLTYYNEDNMYKNMIINEDGEINRIINDSITKKQAYHYSSFDLKRSDNFVPWVKVFNKSCSFAEAYVTYKQNELTKNFSEELIDMYHMIEGHEKKSMKEMMQILKKLKEANQILSSKIGNYESSEYLTDFSINLQNHIYNCVENNIAPDYNSFFINRFKEVSRVIPLHPESLDAYAQFKKYYNSQFDNDYKELHNLKTNFNKVDSLINENLAKLEKNTQIIDDAINNPENAIALITKLLNSASK